MTIIWASLQTPILKRVRGWAWDVWVHSIGKVFQIGNLEVKEDLQTQLETLRSDNARLTSEVRRYQRLEKQLGSGSFSGFRIIPALVSARPIDTFSSKYILDKGTAEGVVQGAPVVAYSSTLIGFISELSTHSSTVTLLLDPSTALPAEVFGDEPTDSPTRGLAQGSYFTNVIISTVPRDQKLSTGMRVVTVAQSGVVPAGLVLGNVGRIFSTEHDAYQSASLNLSYDPGSLEAVAVLIPSSRP